MSMKPGASVRPSASITRAAGASLSCASITAIVSPLTSTFAR
jgi:hypothetical protein